MATNGNTTTSGNSQVSPTDELPAPLLEFIQGIKPSVYQVIGTSVWLGVSIPLMVILFYTSTKGLRRSAIFIANVGGISLGITMDVLSAAFQSNAILDPINFVTGPKVIVYIVLACLAGLYVDCILLFRVYVVFPRLTTARRLWYSLLTLLLSLKIARLANSLVFMTTYFKSGNIARVNGPIDPHFPEEIVEWILQLVDNSICSSLFLWKLQKARGLGLKLKKSSYRQALGTLFWIAATNFVFPCAFDILMIILYFRDPTGMAFNIVYTFNVHVQIIGVLFATVWRATHENTMNTVELSAMPPTEEVKIELAQIGGLQSQNSPELLENHSETALKRPQRETDI